MRGLSLFDTAFLRASVSITPAAFSPVAWFKADDYSQSDGTVLATNWVDHGSEANNGILVAGKEPTFKTAIFGSLPAIRFLSNKYLSRTVKTYGYPGDHTIAWVTKNISGACIGLSKSTDGNVFYGFNSGSANVNIYRVSSGSFTQSTTITPPVTDPRVNWLTTSSAAAIAFRVNKTSYSGGSVTTLGLIVDRIGSDTTANLEDVGEIVIFPGILSTADMDSLYDGYFKPRFTGLP